MKNSKTIICFLLCLAQNFVSAETVPEGKEMGEIQCLCPGVVKPLGGAASCEIACFGETTTSPKIDFEQKNRAAEAERTKQRQAEEVRLENLRLEEKKKKNAQFILDRDASVRALKGPSGNALSQLKGLAGSNSSGLKGTGFDSNTQLKTAPSNDSSMVDARKVPSGLPKSLDKAIAGAYTSAPPGVADRVRKGFQAVMLRDWKVAKVWFEDALNRDPSNEGLKSLVILSDSSKNTPEQRNSVVDSRSEPKGLGGNAQVPASEAQLQLPDPKDIYFLFPGLKAMDEEKAKKEKKVLDLLFGLK